MTRSFSKSKIALNTILMAGPEACLPAGRDSKRANHFFKFKIPSRAASKPE
jgi:hypothetical protein